MEKQLDEQGKNQAIEQSKSKAAGQAAWWQPAIIMFIKLSAWIAGPIIIALYLGKWLDNKYGSEPWLFLLSMTVAFAISIFGLIKNTLKEFKNIDKQNQQPKEKS